MIPSLKIILKKSTNNQKIKAASIEKSSCTYLVILISSFVPLLLLHAYIYIYVHAYRLANRGCMGGPAVLGSLTTSARFSFLLSFFTFSSSSLPLILFIPRRKCEPRGFFVPTYGVTFIALIKIGVIQAFF